MVDTTKVYSTKAEKYAKYRWDYAPSAIESIFEKTQISSQSTIADMGAGTGILTKHFVDRAGKIYAIEPNVELRQELVKNLGNMSSTIILDGSAEDTKLPNNSVNIITVAQAIHWFNPEPARREMMRILKGGGWLVLIRNYLTENGRNRAVGSLMTEEYGADFTVVDKRPEGKPNQYYYKNSNFYKLVFPFQFRQNWEEFIGALTTAAYMPDEDHPKYDNLETKAKEIFSQYSEEGYWLVEGETELIIGQPMKQT